MSATRTVFWLALITAIVPFLAIPSWLMQTVVAGLALVIMITARLASTTQKPQTLQPPQVNNGNDEPKTDNTKTTTDSTPTESNKKDSTADSEPVDVTNPDADRMMASEQWRRRSSRNIGGSNS